MFVCLENFTQKSYLLKNLYPNDLLFLEAISESLGIVCFETGSRRVQRQAGLELTFVTQPGLALTVIPLLFPLSQSHIEHFP